MLIQTIVVVGIVYTVVAVLIIVNDVRKGPKSEWRNEDAYGGLVAGLVYFADRALGWPWHLYNFFCSLFRLTFPSQECKNKRLTP